ncbi:MAG TPA: DNA adenine methylase [Longimicrobiales bacterium]|nr:DNA adenine methylase [Longimicrobiales bacterium]
MRYIGNKTRLLYFVRRVLRARGIPPGRALDPFSGTASVARALKRWQFHVAASDIMTYGYVFAHAYVQLQDRPRFDGLAAAGRAASLHRVMATLNALPAQPAFIHEHFSPAGTVGAQHGRMYFTPQNAARIDAIRVQLEEWNCAGRLTADEYYLLLAALIEAADRVANTTGVYAAFVKSWQPNALRPLQLRVQRHVSGNGCSAARIDAIRAVERAGDFDLLYLDPPYNARQYSGYYHVPELLARGWFDGPISMRGKTGLIADDDLRSDWSSSRRCEAAFEQLVASARCKHIIMSYNAEGIIPENTIERVLKDYGRRDTYRRHRTGYRRYRSDHDRATRQYAGDAVDEYLYCVAR